MKYLLPFILLISIGANAQLQRYDSYAATTASASGIGNLTQVIPNATLQVFNYPGAGVNCGSGGCVAATTYTSRTGATACGAGVPLTRPTTNVCISTADAQGNFGFWAPAGNYQYCIVATFATQCTNIVLGPALDAANIQYATQFPGADCGAKVNAADAALGSSSGLIYVNAALCGLTWTTAVSISSGHTLRFTSTTGGAFQVFTSAGISLDGSQAAIDGQVGALNNVSIAAANGSNIPYVVRMNNSLQSLSNLTVDGNVANNPTGGVSILVTNAAPRPFFWRVNAQGAPSFGIYFNSNVAGSGAFDGHIDNTYVLNNQDGGLLLRNTTDLFIENTAIDINGSIGTVNTQNAATGGCAANCVTWVSGNKWTTDTSLVGAKIIIGTTFYFISSIQSTTVLTISAAPGTQTGVNYGIGSNIELSDSPGLRIEHSDIGTGGSCGLWMYGTSAGKQSTRELIGPDIQFGNTNNHDICIAGWDTVGGAYAAGQYSIISNNSFIGLTAGATDNKWDHIYCIDCSNLQIVGNNFFSLNSPLRNKAGIEYVENLNGEGTKARPLILEGNYFSDPTAGAWSVTGTFGTAKIINSTANGMSGQVLWNNGFSGNPLSATAFCDEASADTTPCKFLTIANGVYQLSSNANAAIWSLADAGAISQVGLTTKYGNLSTTGNGLNSLQASSGAITIGSGTSIAATSLCSTTQCPAGRYRVDVYIDITTACTTTGSYIVWLGYTDDQGAKAGSSTTTYFSAAGGLGVTPATATTGATLGLASTANFLTGTYFLTTTGAATGGLGSINYGTTATACGTGGPMVGKMYFDVTRLE